MISSASRTTALPSNPSTGREHGRCAMLRRSYSFEAPRCRSHTADRIDCTVDPDRGVEVSHRHPQFPRQEADHGFRHGWCLHRRLERRKAGGTGEVHLPQRRLVQRGMGRRQSYRGGHLLDAAVHVRGKLGPGLETRLWRGKVRRWLRVQGRFPNGLQARARSPYLAGLLLLRGPVSGQQPGGPRHVHLEEQTQVHRPVDRQLHARRRALRVAGRRLV
mmetsp:Transcript_41242/g.93014  ORF Transcript_41242/g.93014 Transcript_41242/m.93014 type:complete len:218 (+) Transcript_41242:2-655(+)